MTWGYHEPEREWDGYDPAAEDEAAACMAAAPNPKPKLQLREGPRLRVLPGLAET